MYTLINPSLLHVYKSGVQGGLNYMGMLGHRFLIFCFTDFFRNKLVSEDEIKIKFIRTIFQLN